MSQTTEIIKELRELSLSQSEISRLTGIPQPRISRWESGDGARSVDDGLRLADLLKTVKKAARKAKSNNEKAG